jgi:hypothetical protein
VKKLETTKKIIIGSTVRAYRKGFGYSKLTIVENNEHYLAATAEEAFFHSVQEGDIVEAYLWVHDVASYEFYLQLIGKIVIGPRILFFGHTEKISRSVERKCLTANVDLPIKFFTFDPGDVNKGISSEKIVAHSGTVILLSDREATLRSEENICCDRFFKGQIMIPDETIELIGMVEPVNEEKLLYNILFSGMHDKERNKLLEYVFSTYRE